MQHKNGGMTAWVVHGKKYFSKKTCFRPLQAAYVV